jgi:hypothetical protein
MSLFAHELEALVLELQDQMRSLDSRLTALEGRVTVLEGGVAEPPEDPSEDSYSVEEISK